MNFSGMFLCHVVPWSSVGIHRKFYGDRPRRSPSAGGLNARGVVKYSDFGPGYRRLYLGNGVISSLQSIQNAAACSLTGDSRRDHISPVLLHWLSVKQRVHYKLATIVYKSLRGQAPSYLVDDCHLIVDSGRPQLRSAHANSLFREQTLDLATGVSRLLVRELGAVYTRLTAAA